MSENSAGPQGSGDKSTTGLEPNIAAGLCYLIGFVTGIVFLVLEKDSKFVRFHAMQSIMVFGGVFVVNVVLTMIPVLGWLLGLILTPIWLVLWILLMVQGFRGVYFKLPLIGDMAENQI